MANPYNATGLWSSETSARPKVRRAGCAERCTFHLRQTAASCGLLSWLVGRLRWRSGAVARVTLWLAAS